MFVFVSFPSSTLSTFIKILSLCCFPSLSHLGLSVSQGRRKAEELNPLVDSVLTEVRCKDLFPQMIWVRLLEKSYTMLLKKGVLLPCLLFMLYVLVLLNCTSLFDDDDGVHGSPVYRAPTVPTISRMHSSCCCPSCRSPTSRASTVGPPQNQQPRHNNNTHTNTHTRYMLTRLS